MGVTPLDRRVDIYSLTAVTYAMLTGHPPFWCEASPCIFLALAALALFTVSMFITILVLR
jgi:serine/threonine protein kinase